MIRVLLSIYIVFACAVVVKSQFPAVCNNAMSISSKTCCPNDCGGANKGNCTDITAYADETWSRSRPDIVEIIRNSTNLPGKGKADFRYKWPTVVFERVCVCGGNYYGADCTECKFGYTGDDCGTRKTIITRKTFSRLNQTEKDEVIQGYSLLKHDYGRWGVVVDEPVSYNSGSVTLLNVSTYDMIVFLHSVVGRDEKCRGMSDPTIDFGHEGPSFPMWHRHYLLLLEREMQRVLGNDLFALPHWSWDIGEVDLFVEEHLGFPASTVDSAVNVTSTNFNNTVWPMVCDGAYRNTSISCADFWKLCNPETDRLANGDLQRGMRSSSSYLPTVQEILIAITAPSYDTSDKDGNYGITSPFSSFRNRLEGFSRICSASNCIGFYKESHLHNIVHLWIGGHMGINSAAVNDPLFFLHHCNIDRVLESWIRKFAVNSSNPFLLPAYAPAHGGHPGHNKVDWMVPFFPLVRIIDYYNTSEEFGYVYEHLFESSIPDSSLEFCVPFGACATCTSNDGDCINCGASGKSDNCIVETPTLPPPAASSLLSPDQLLLILVLGIPLLICLIILVLLTIALLFTFLKRRKN